MDVQNKNPKKKILIFGHYYVPDTASTGQLLKDLAEGMLDKFDVTVICVVPSYGGTIAPEYKTHKFYFEEINGVKIVRVRVPEFTKSNRISRIKNIVAYFFGALKASRKAATKRAGRIIFLLFLSRRFLAACLVYWVKNKNMQN